MTGAIYRVDGHRVETRPHAAGPWDASMQHGSPPAALATWIAESLPTPQPMHVARVTIDLMRPVPVAPLTFDAQVLREGRKIQLCGVTLLADGVPVVRASVLKIRSEPQPLPPDVRDHPVEQPLPDDSPLLTPDTGVSPFLRAMSLRSAQGDFGTLGPGAIWYRIDDPIVEGATNSQAMRAMVAADFCNGTSSALDFRKWRYLNADLTVNFARPPLGDWILVDAQSWVGSDGAGIAAARLGDIKGYFGRAVQTLVIERR